MANLKIHFTDNYGCGTIECETREQLGEIMKNLREDPNAEDIWTEHYDPEEGWQA